jgi:hypothetical protein
MGRMNYLFAEVGIDILNAGTSLIGSVELPLQKRWKHSITVILLPLF